MKHPSKRSDRPSRHRLRRLGIALALSATTFGAQAAGLGRLNLLSGLGQPLRAEIELTSVTREDAGTLTARLAPAAAFTQAGIEYGASLASLRFSIQRRPNGQQYVLVTSNQQVNEPFLDMLVELTWASGRLVREYTVLLDPPETRAAQAPAETAAPVVPATTTDASPTIVRRTPRAPAPTTSSGDGSAAPASSRRAAPSTSSAAPSTGSSSGDYLVQSGDTAMSIARANKPDGVSLEQMLAALYRDNPQAFSGNVNRLLAGATLRIPDAPAAQAIDAPEARRIVAQSSNFGSYRERLARNPAAAASARTPGQQASGQLSTQVQDRAAPAGNTDRLQLSRPDTSRAAGPATGATRAGAGSPTADELASKDRELQETRTRLALLEKNVADLQELLKLKNQTLADLQKGAAGSTAAASSAPGSAPVAATTPSTATTTASTTSPPTTAPTTTAPTTSASPTTATTTAPNTANPATPPPPVSPTTTPPASIAAPATTAPTPPAPAATPVPAPAPVAKAAPAATTPAAEPSFFDTLMDNTLLLVALVVLALLVVGYAIFAARRRRMARFEDSIFVDNSVLRANSVFGTTGGQSVDTANSGFHSNFVPVAGALPEHNEVDPVAEADVYIAYGRDAQAEEILKEALRADPSRHAVRLKLLEIYAKRNDSKTFETMASELYAATGGQGEEWRQAAALGATIDPRNPLYTETPAVETAAPAATGAPAPRAAPFSGSEFNAAPLNFGVSDIGIRAPAPDPGSPLTTDIDFPRSMARTDPMPRTPSTPTPAPAMDLDFDLGNTGAAAPPAPGASTAPIAGASTPADAPAEFTPAMDPFTASAFGNADPQARTAVNLPAFRARADQPSEPPPEATNIGRDPDGFTASDIFGSSIVADTMPLYSETPPSPPPAPPARPAARHDLQDDAAFEKTEPFDASFSGVNLDLDRGDFPAATQSDINGRTDIWQAMATKLDLALAYSDIGDKDGARELLEEVVRNGDPAQADRARHLITELG